MSKTPPAGQGPFHRGERLTAVKLNDVVNAIKPVRVGGRAGIIGDAIVSDETERAYIRITGHTGTNPRKFAWQEVYRTPNGTWANGTRSGNSTYDWAIEQNDHNVGSGSTVYEAVRSPDTSEWIFHRDHGGGNATVVSGETVLMILGTYDEYKTCPNTPPSPPTTYTDYCNGTTGTDLCVPAYAYAVYQRCGYEWNKVGDTRDYQVWANELNGGTTAAWRRLFVPRWGGELSNGVPAPSDACMGVAFLGYSSQGALTCDCPSWLADVECLKIKITWVPQPNSKPADCPQACWDDMAGKWGTTSTVTMEPLAVNGCQMTGDISPFSVTMIFQDRPRTDCYWGPDVFDPCDPCAGFGRIVVSINSANCGGANNAWLGRWVDTKPIRDLICNCTIGPVSVPNIIPTIGPCGNLVSSITIECC